MSSCCCQGVDELFGERAARHDLRRYRNRGPSRSTRLLLNALRAEGIAGATVLDIGGGVGVIQHELLHAGAESATGVEASGAYLRAAREEAARRGHAERITYREGDFVALADGVAPADVVTLDRVICCYPDMEALVGASAERAQRLYGLVYPRDPRWLRFGLRFVVNGCMRLTRRTFRTYAHRTAAVDAAARRRGLEPRLRRRVGLVWQVVVYRRATAMSRGEPSS
jgi:magnesium-protoporphyrin O-methyltransferase